MEKPWVYLSGLVVCAILVFFTSNHLMEGYLRSEETLAKEVKSRPSAVEEYRIASQAPFKYRLLFPAIIKGTYGIFYGTASGDGKGFYHTYKFWSGVFYVSSVLAFFFLLSTSGFNAPYSFGGTLIFLLLPPMLVAFTLPVHTREDTLAYTVMFLGLIAIIKRNPGWVLIISMVGAITRETLLLLPLLYFFYSEDRLLWRRIVIAGVPGLLWISTRILMGNEQYDVLEGLRWNLANPEQVAGFLFVSFNVCWLSYVLHVVFFRRGVREAEWPRKFFYKSSLFTLSVILITTFAGGIFNEIRLLYLFAPWMIIIFLDFIRENTGSIMLVMSRKGYWWYVLGCLAFCVVLLVVVSFYRERIIVPGKWAVPYEQWIVLSICYFFILLLFLPVTLRVYSIKRSVK
jgi:hypothetical protein